MYKEAIFTKLRIPTSKGMLSPEQLCDLDINTLDSTVVALDEAYKNSKGKSFLTKRTVRDKTIKLQFDIALDILLTKNEMMEDAEEKRQNRIHNNKIDALIAEKEEDELKKLSLSDLKRMRK